MKNQNRAHRKGGQSKTVPQVQTANPAAAPSRQPKATRQPSAFLRLHGIKAKPGFEISIGAEALGSLEAAGLSLTAMQPELALIAKGLRPGCGIEVDYQWFITAHKRVQGVKQIEGLLGLTKAQSDGLLLICAWEQQDPLALAKAALLASLEGSSDDMRGFAGQKPGYESPKDQAWAQEFWPMIKALRPKGGW